jgi:FtsP/CotA-like multicopper oxidase with cupredoxin domain
MLAATAGAICGIRQRQRARIAAKDTVIVRPGQQVACDLDAANPGQWMTHCHNLYHAPEAA